MAGMTPLHLAAHFGVEKVAELLVAEGANVNTRDCKGMTPKTHATRNGYGTVVKVILEAGGVESGQRDNKNRSPLWYASGKGHEAVAKLLLSTGADVNSQGDVLLEWGIEPALTLPVYDSWGFISPSTMQNVWSCKLMSPPSSPLEEVRLSWTPLCYAAIEGREGMVELLLQTKRVDVSLQNGQGRPDGFILRSWWRAPRGCQTTVV
jgi:ankyrin repeat protein